MRYGASSSAASTRLSSFWQTRTSSVANAVTDCASRSGRPCQTRELPQTDQLRGVARVALPLQLVLVVHREGHRTSSCGLLGEVRHEYKGSWRLGLRRLDRAGARVAL